MNLRCARRVAGLLLGLSGAFVWILPSNALDPDPTPALVYSAEVDSVIQPVSAEYMTATIDRADAAHAALLVFTLRTPGGLVDSTREVVTRMLAAKTPIAVFVAPAGARAASAGFILILASDVAAMAPGTHIGAAHPVAGGGEPMNETMAKKAAQDVAAYVRTLAEKRHRNVALAEQAVNDSRAFTDEEALAASPPLVDLVAPDLPTLLQRLDGRRITRFDGSSSVLRTANAQVVAIEMTTRQRVLSAIAHPNIAYLLLSIGMLGLTIELWTPGAVLPGIVGGVSLLLAFFSLSLLPVNYAGLLLIMLGLLLFALEIKVTSYGLLTVGGITSLVLGSMILIDSSAPDLRLSLRFVLPVVIGFAGIAILLVRLAVAAQRLPPATGATAMIGQIGEAMTPIGPDQIGSVAIRGEIWQATAGESIPERAQVRVTDVRGLTLTVRLQ
jgi:membrane-bound serine protease (ClpP class)